MTEQILVGYTPVFNNAGTIAAGGSATFYETGTTTLINIYSDAAGTTPLPNPLGLGADGRPDNGVQVFHSETTGVKVVFKDSVDATINTVDPAHTTLVAASAASAVAYAPNNLNDATNVQDAITNASTPQAVRFASAEFIGTTLVLTNDVGGDFYDFNSIPDGLLVIFDMTPGDENPAGPITCEIESAPALACKTVTGESLPEGYLKGDLSPIVGRFDGVNLVFERPAETITSIPQPDETTIRYADGRQESFRTAVTMSAATSVSASETWTFDQPFTEVYSVDLSPSFLTADWTNSTARLDQVGASWNSISNTGVDLRILFSVQYTVTISNNRARATGRWY